jgi:autotransporter translocation and assembly factor TamB
MEGARRGDRLSGHLALTNLRLGQLPTALIDPKMRLDGVLNVDVKAGGRVEEPKIAAVVDLKQAAYQGFSKIDAKLKAKLEHDQVDGTVAVDAPFLAAGGKFELPTALAAGEPIDVKLDIKHMDLGQLMRAAERPPLADGRLNVKLRAEGSADDPKVTVTMEAFDLELKQPAAKTPAARSVDLGKAHVRLTYADRSARAEVDFAAAHGGTLKVDATTRVDLSYPRVTRRRIVAAKLPIHGKIVARNLDAAWVAELVPRLESMGGQVTADARLGGTVGDPQVIGDVRWNNGKVVATPAPPPSARQRPAAGAQGRAAPSPR